MSRENKKTSSLLEGGAYTPEMQKGIVYPAEVGNGQSNPRTAQMPYGSTMGPELMDSLFGEGYVVPGAALNNEEVRRQEFVSAPAVDMQRPQPVANNYEQPVVNPSYVAQPPQDTVREVVADVRRQEAQVVRVESVPEYRENAQESLYRQEVVTNSGVDMQRTQPQPQPQPVAYAPEQPMVNPGYVTQRPQEVIYNREEPQEVFMDVPHQRIPAPNINFTPEKQVDNRENVYQNPKEPSYYGYGQRQEEGLYHQGGTINPGVDMQRMQPQPQPRPIAYTPEQPVVNPGYVAQRPQEANYGQRVQNNIAPQRSSSYVYASLEQPEAQYHGYKKELICVHSPKGGVGKSTISKELAIALSKAEPNKKNYRVLLVDADWEFGDVATLLNISPYPNVSDWVKVMLRDRKEYGRIPFYATTDIKANWIIDYGRVRPDLELHVLAGCGNATDAALIDEEIVVALIENLRRCDYDYIIFDNANSIHPKTVIPLMRCDKMILVETLDTTTITETTVLLETLKTKQFDFNKLLMVLNQVPMDEKKLDISVHDLEHLLDMRMAAIIPEHGDVRLRNNAGESLMDGKDTPVTKELKKLVSCIAPVYPEKKQGFLSKLFGKK